MADFALPKITDNPNGWGPCAVPEKFKDMPYQPFSKSDRLGKVSDWTLSGNQLYNDKKYNNKYTSQFSTSGAGQYAYYHEHDDHFQIVDTIKPSRPFFRGIGRGRYNPMQRGRGRGASMPNRGSQNQGNSNAWRGNSGNQQSSRGWQRGKIRGNRNRNWNNNNRNQVSRKASVDVKQDWDEIDYYDFPRLTKLKLPDVNKPVELVTAGTLEYYDQKFDRVNTKSERYLTAINRRIPTVTTTSDPVIRRLAAKQGNVFATDIILATLMCCTRSVYSWDIVATKLKGKIFLDKREDSLSFDCLTVNETAHEPLSTDPNELKVYSDESTHVNYCFTQQVLKKEGDAHKFKEPNPFEDEDDDDEPQDPLAPIGYKYKMWDLGNDIKLVCRCEHDAVSKGPDDKTHFLTIKALNEVEHRSEWHQKLDQQSGAIIATELKNNSFKIGKWCLQAYLSGSDFIKLGFVSRVNPRDSKTHEILKVQSFEPSNLATSINLNFDNCWGILRAIIDAINRQPEEAGKYLLLKDPNKTTIRLYKIPMNTFSDDEDDSEEETIPEENEKE